jgi:hypothetical protein
MLKNKYSLIGLDEYITNMVIDATNSIKYWKKYKHRKCYKCGKKGHLIKHCNEICNYCDNKHSVGLCPFLINQLLKKTQNVLIKNQYRTLNEINEKLNESTLKLKMKILRRNNKFNNNEFQINNQMLEFKASKPNLFQHKEAIDKMMNYEINNQYKPVQELIEKYIKEENNKIKGRKVNKINVQQPRNAPE